MILATPWLVLLATRSLLEMGGVGSGPPPGWTVMSKHGVPRIERTVRSGVTGVCLDAADASFSINRAVDHDLGPEPLLSWTWRADVLPANGDFRDSARDDQAAQLFVVFARQGLFSTPAAINYIWDSSAPVDARGDYRIPLIINVKTIVVESGPARRGEWRTVTRDVAADYRTSFGGEPPRVAAVRFQANSQHTHARAAGCLAAVTFSSPHSGSR